jgi:hypothetical protein
MSADLNSDETFSLDVKRSIILAEYIKCWGMPEARSLMLQSEMSHNEMSVELYLFPGEDMDQVSRVVTIGLSACEFPDGKICNNELLMVLPFDVAEDEWHAVSEYIFELSSYIVNSLGRNIQTEDLKQVTDTAPEGWPKALLFDDPRGEPNELNHFYIGMQHVTLSWAVPIFASEYELIKGQGIEAFDAAVENAEMSLVEVRRESCV